jgi:Fur family transcriptional regulator, zinc uptake regulator
MPRNPAVPKPAAAFPDVGHNHGKCLHAALDRARTAFEAKGLRLTDLRRRVFAEIAGSHHAVGAYHVLDRLSGTGGRLAPISVYRAIDALLSAGCIHRLESRNAFFACHTGAAHGCKPLVLVCETCGQVAEIAADAMFDALDTALGISGFTPRRTIAEVSGTCAGCTAGGAP